MSELAANRARFLFGIRGLDAHMRVVRFRGVEALSRPFLFEAELACEDPSLDFEQAVDHSAGLTLLGEGEPRHINAIVTRFEQGGSGNRFTLYRATLAPKLWRLSLRSGCRIFQEKSVPEIVSQIFDEAGIPGDEYRLSLSGDYRPREYCVQYRESELEFVQRLLEEEGVFYFHEHLEDKHVLVLGDHPAAHPGIPGGETVPFHDKSGELAEREHVHAFEYAESLTADRSTLRDFDFSRPSLDLESGVAEGEGARERYDYPGGYRERVRGRGLARVRLEEERVASREARGETTSPRMTVGQRFALTDHPRSAFNQGYLLTEIELSGEQHQVLEEGAAVDGGAFSAHFRAIPVELPYRPARITPRPLIDSAQTAIVVGPSAEEIYTDEFGRVKVQFHWDREGRGDERSSCWIRVAQSWAGRGWGALTIPRVGHEVVVNFLEGDPDQPIILGSVYHGINQPPYELPARKTRSTLKSRSSKGGDGYNEIRMEDLKGSEQLFVHAQKDLDIRVENDRLENVGRDRHLTVERHRMDLVKGARHITVQGDDRLDAGRDVAQRVRRDLHREVGRKELTAAGMEIHLKSGMKIILDATTEMTLRAGGSFIRLDPSGVTIHGRKVRINSGGRPAAGTMVEPPSPARPMEADSDRPGRRGHVPPSAAPPPVRPVDSAAFSYTLEAAARNGVPFCEVCEQDRQTHGRGEG